jgi:cysteine desulfuration protein SufE
VTSVQGRLDEIAEEFAELEPRERLELLLDFAENLPPLPPDLQAQRDAGEHRVPECQTPVFLWVLPEGDVVRVHGDVAPEAPTVKGFVGIMVEACSGARPQEILAADPNLVQRLGLVEALGMVRMRGLSAIVNRIRRETQQVLAKT